MNQLKMLQHFVSRNQHRRSSRSRYEIVVINERKRQSTIAWNTVPNKKGNTSHCSVCGKEGPSTKGRNGKKVD